MGLLRECRWDESLGLAIDCRQVSSASGERKEVELDNIRDFRAQDTADYFDLPGMTKYMSVYDKDKVRFGVYVEGVNTPT